MPPGDMRPFALAVGALASSEDGADEFYDLSPENLPIMGVNNFGVLILRFASLKYF